MRSKQTTRLLVKAKAVNSTLLTRETLNDYPEDRRITVDGYTYGIEEKESDEIKLTLLAKQTLHLKTIKNIVIFFLTMWLIGTIITIAYTVKFMTAISSIM